MSGNTYKATVKYAGDEFFIGIPPSGHAQLMDTKGDRHAAPTPMEMLLVSVAACTAVDVISILLKKRQDVTDYNVEINGTRTRNIRVHLSSFTSTISCTDATFRKKPSPTRSSSRTQNTAPSPRPSARRPRSRRASRSSKCQNSPRKARKTLTFFSLLLARDFRVFRG